MNRTVFTAETLQTETAAAYQVTIWFTNCVYADTLHRPSNPSILFASHFEAYFVPSVYDLSVRPYPGSC
jgi:cytochrome c oxidase assembly factor CtaG